MDRITWDLFFNTDAQALPQTHPLNLSLLMVRPAPELFESSKGVLSEQPVPRYRVAVSSPVSRQLRLWCLESILEESHQASVLLPKKTCVRACPRSVRSGSSVSPQHLTQASPLRHPRVHPKKVHGWVGEAKMVPENISWCNTCSKRNRGPTNTDPKNLSQKLGASHTY